MVAGEEPHPMPFTVTRAPSGCVVTTSAVTDFAGQAQAEAQLPASDPQPHEERRWKRRFRASRSQASAQNQSRREGRPVARVVVEDRRLPARITPRSPQSQRQRPRYTEAVTLILDRPGSLASLLVLACPPAPVRIRAQRARVVDRDRRPAHTSAVPRAGRSPTESPSDCRVRTPRDAAEGSSSLGQLARA